MAELSPAPAVRLNGRLGCLTIVAGTFEPGGPGLPARVTCRARSTPRPPRSRRRSGGPTAREDSLENVLRRGNVCLARARAVYEARFEFSEDGTAWRLRNAGYRIERLLTTERDDTERSLFYTLDVRAPGRTKDPELLSTAWIDLGRVKAGARDAGTTGVELPWLRVPPMSDAARRFYEETTVVHQETAAQVEALQRAIARNESVRAALEQRRRKASGALAQSLRAELVRIQTQGLTLQAELDARRAEYAGLRQDSLELMPVSIEVGVTETASERKALRALASVIEGNRDFIASTVVGAASGLVARRSIDAAARAADVAADAGSVEWSRQAAPTTMPSSRPASGTAQAARRPRPASAPRGRVTMRRGVQSRHPRVHSRWTTADERSPATVTRHVGPTTRRNSGASAVRPRLAAVLAALLLAVGPDRLDAAGYRAGGTGNVERRPGSRAAARHRARPVGAADPWPADRATRGDGAAGSAAGPVVRPAGTPQAPTARPKRRRQARRRKCPPPRVSHSTCRSRSTPARCDRRPPRSSSSSPPPCVRRRSRRSGS